jgi:hypothetical protein
MSSGKQKLYAAIRADRKAGLSWKALTKKHRCTLYAVTQALKGWRSFTSHSTKMRAHSAKTRAPGSSFLPAGMAEEIAGVTEKLTRGKKTEGGYFVTSGSNKIPSLESFKTKDEALKAVLEAQLRRVKHVKLLREIPFKLTVVADE